MRQAHPKRPARPLLIVGWDGATPELVGPWLEDGTLPHLAALRARGSFAPLRSVLHPLSPAAWTSAFTGLCPGRHGVWDFGHIVPGTYRVEPTTGAQRRGASLWEIAEECGLRSVVANVPISSPCRPFDGVFVPGLGAAKLEGATHPEGLARQIAQASPGYTIDANIYEHEAPSDFLESVERMVDARTTVFEALIRREQPDLFFGVYVSTDRIQHAFWEQSDHPWLDGERASWRFAHAIRRSYQQLDSALGRLIEACEEEPTVLVVSDHGFGDLEGDLYLNTLLEEMGLLVVRSGAAGDSFGDIDWSRTRAYARGLFGNIWLNLRGREPLGQVEPGPEADALLYEITDRLRGLRAPGGGAPIVQAVFRGDELYASDGERKPTSAEGGAPDLVVVPRDYRWMTRSGRELDAARRLTSAPAIRHSGNHRMNGVIVAGGPGLEVGAVPGLQHLIDLTPTALALLGIEVPRSLDGRPMAELLACDVAWTDDIPAWEPLEATALGQEQSTEALEDQLAGLGYLAR